MQASQSVLQIGQQCHIKEQGAALSECGGPVEACPHSIASCKAREKEARIKTSDASSHLAAGTPWERESAGGALRDARRSERSAMRQQQSSRQTCP